MDDHKPQQQPHHDDSSPKKTPSTVASDRMKRDEWSEGAVSSLLEAYETKWILRNRAKLKGQDWEDVAKYVSSRSNSTKSLKTQTQCKNKIESMKKRYRSESANAEVSSWPLFPRLDLLLRGNSGGSVKTVVVSTSDLVNSPVPVSSNLPMIAFDHAPPASLPPPVTTTMMMNMMVNQSSSVPVSVSEPAPVAVAIPMIQGIEQNSVDSNGVDRENKVCFFYLFFFLNFNSFYTILF